MFGTTIDKGIATVEGWFTSAAQAVVVTPPPPVSAAAVDLSQELQWPTNASPTVGAVTSTPAAVTGNPALTVALVVIAAVIGFKWVKRHA